MAVALALVDSQTTHKKQVLSLLVALSKPFYMAKAIDVFLDLPESHQNGLCEFLVDHIDNDNLTRLMDDRHCLNAFKSALLLYSGSEAKNELSVKDFKILIVDYVGSAKFKEADSSAKMSNTEIMDFERELEEI